MRIKRDSNANIHLRKVHVDVILTVTLTINEKICPYGAELIWHFWHIICLEHNLVLVAHMSKYIKFKWLREVKSKWILRKCS